MLSRWWSGSRVQRLRSNGEHREGVVHIFYHELRAPAGRSCCHTFGVHYHTDIVLLWILWSQLGPGMIGRLRCMSLTSYLEVPERRCNVWSHRWIGYSSDGQWRWPWRIVHTCPSVWVQMALSCAWSWLWWSSACAWPECMRCTLSRLLYTRQWEIVER